MGKLFRWIEPALLLSLKAHGRRHGYRLAEDVNRMALAEEPIEGGAIYRILRQLEEEGHVVSEWDITGNGPARRHYCLTQSGEELLEMWVEIIERRADALSEFIATYKRLRTGEEAVR